MEPVNYYKKWEDVNDSFDSVGLPYFKGDTVLDYELKDDVYGTMG